MSASRAEGSGADDTTPESPALLGGETLILGPEIQSRLAEGRKAFELHDYIGCVRALKRIPEPLRSAEVHALRERAAIAADELSRIQSEVKQALRSRAYDGLIPTLQRYRELRPGDAKYDKLLAQLQEREARRAGSTERLDPVSRPARGAAGSRVALRVRTGELQRYLFVGAFAGGVLGALLGGFWKPEGYVVGGVLGGVLAAVNEWLRVR